MLKAGLKLEISNDMEFGTSGMSHTVPTGGRVFDLNNPRPPEPQRHRRFKSFADLSRELRETGEDLERLVYPNLEFGAFFRIPNDETGFGDDRRGWHPWVIIVPYAKGRATVTLCPRTSSGQSKSGRRELVTPADVVPGLDRSGRILLHLRRPLPISNFRNYDKIGRLSDEWCEQLRQALAAIADALPHE
jgi:mRNA-degrading endonuclease toxin of MazEF toxin-antitoxin module